MGVNPIYTPSSNRPMRIAGFISGSGTNLEKILENQHHVEKETGNKPYEVVVVFTDNVNSNAEKIGTRFNVPVVIHDIMEFYKSKGHDNKKDLSLRPEFDLRSIEMLSTYDFDVIALAGYMSIVTKPLLEKFEGRIINVHPADLTITKDGKRLYTGDYAVGLAIKNGEKTLHCSTHIVREQVDYGEILMVSKPLPVILPEGITVETLKEPDNKDLYRKIADEHQDRLKEVGDWVIFPRTLELIAQGRFGIDDNGRVCFDGKPVPRGYRE